MSNFSLFVLFVFFLLSACSTPNVTVSTVETPEIQAPSPAPLNLKNVEWKVLNKAELSKLLDQVNKSGNNDFVIYAVTPDGFENLNGNIVELRRYLLEQKEAITFYQQIQKPAKKN